MANVIHVRTGLTPSRNEMDKLIYARNFKKIAKIKNDYYRDVILTIPEYQRKTFIKSKPGSKTSVWFVSKHMYDHLYVYVIRCGKRGLDHTNLIGGLKWLEDVVVKCGLIKNDSPEHITWIMSGAECRSPRRWKDPFPGPMTHLLLSENKDEIVSYINRI